MTIRCSATADMDGVSVGAILQTVEQFFEEDGWGPAEANGGLSLAFRGRNGQWRCFARVREAEGQFLFYSFAPVEVPQDQMQTMLELVAWANVGLFIGNFEVNPRNGTLQFRTSIDVEGDEACLRPPLIKHLVYQNVLTMDKYLPAIRSVLGGANPEQAVAGVEGD